MDKGSEPDPEAQELLGLWAVQAGLALDACLARRAERAGRAFLDGVVAAVPAPLLLVAPDGTLAAVNALAAELFSLSADFDRGRPVAGRLRAPELEPSAWKGPGASSTCGWAAARRGACCTPAWRARPTPRWWCSRTGPRRARWSASRPTSSPWSATSCAPR